MAFRNPPVIDIGNFNELKIAKLSALGALLEGGPLGPILLPAGEVPAGAGPGATVEVFIYRGPDDQLLATTTAPAAQVGQVACLKIVRVNDAGAFLAWGLTKDLLLPWNEVPRGQKHSVAEGRWIVVAVFLAEDGRIAASARLDDFIKDEAEGLAQGDRVELLVAATSDLGLRVIVNHRYWGLVHRNEVFGARSRGQVLEGYVKMLRADGKLDIALGQPGRARIGTAAEAVLRALQKAGGYLEVTDKTSPEEIYSRFGVSKKTFKQTIGALYKSGEITLEVAGIRSVPKPPGR
jgi:predicted RNA-binding protein (virulence factor B family)